MKAFKFRSADQLPFALDIILNQRLYCADWRILNDPLEGRFTYSYQVLSPYTGALRDNSEHWDKFADEIIHEKQRRRICSLSLTAESKLLWAHYASGFAGLALELELPDEDDRVRVVEYVGACNVDLDANLSPDASAMRVLSTKYPEWSYEQEVRVIQTGEWFPLQRPVNRVICGPRINPAAFQGLRLICESKGIPITIMHVDDEGIDLSGERSPARKLAMLHMAKRGREQKED